MNTELTSKENVYRKYIKKGVTFSDVQDYFKGLTAIYDTN